MSEHRTEQPRRCRANLQGQAGPPDRWETSSVVATVALGEALGRSLGGGLVVGLVGPLGAGKTQLVKGIATGNGIDDVRKVTSPTFTLVHEYPGRLRLYHVDVYRLEDSRELEALGFEEWINPTSSVVIEWADRVRPLLPVDTLWIELKVTGETQRTFEFTADGEQPNECLDRLRRTWR